MSGFKNLRSDEFKYFFPRILELTALFEFPSHTAEIVFHRMNLRETDSWKVTDWNPNEKKYLMNL